MRPGEKKVMRDIVVAAQRVLDFGHCNLRPPKYQARVRAFDALDDALEAWRDASLNWQAPRPDPELRERVTHEQSEGYRDAMMDSGRGSLLR